MRKRLFTAGFAPPAQNATGHEPLSLVVMTDRYPELSQTFVSAEVESLRRDGHRVRVEAGTPGNVPLSDDDVAYLVDDGRADRVASMIRLGVRHPWRVLADLVRRRRWRRSEETVPLRTLACCVDRIARHRASHIHVHFADRAALDALRIARILGLPWSVTAHAYDIFSSPRNLVEKMESAAFVTSGCKYNVDYLQGLVDPEFRGRIHEVIMGIDGNRFRRNKPHRETGVVVSVGRLVEKKGFRYLIEAASVLRDNARLDRLIVVGAGPLEAELRALVDDLSLTDSVELIGAKSGAAIREILDQADVFAMPCVVARDGDRDSMPVVVKEALAMEIPVVASDEVGLPELVRPKWGRLVPPGDSQALARALDELLSLPSAKRAEMGKAGRTHVLAAADVAAETNKVVRLIRASQPA